MKKYLLLAFLTALSTIVSAQTVKQRTHNAQTKKVEQKTALTKKDIKLVDAPFQGVKQSAKTASTRAAAVMKQADVLLKTSTPAAKRIAISKKEMKTMKSIKPVSKAPRKAAADLHNAYNGKGIDYSYDGTTESETPVSWEMNTAVVTWEDNSESDVLVNVVPMVEDFSDVEGFEEGFFHEYEVNGDVLSIPADFLVSYQNSRGTTYYIALVAVDNRANLLGDGTIEMKIGSDGSLTPSNTTLYSIGVFSEPVISAETYLGYYTLTLDVEYKFDGQQAEMPEGVTATAEYDAYGYSFNTKANETWTLYKGTKEIDKRPHDVFVNVIPTPSYLKNNYPNGIAVEYMDNGKTISIAPQKVGEVALQSGVGYCYIFSYANSSTDGSINLTTNENGELTTVDGEMILIGVFSTDAFDYNLGSTWLGQIAYYQDVNYLKKGQIPAPVPEAELDGVYLNGEITPTFYGTNDVNVYVPALSTNTFKNLSDETTSANTYGWEIKQLSWNGATYDEVETLTGSDRDFTLTTGYDDVYSLPTLTATNEGGEADYVWGMAHYDGSDPIEGTIESSVFAPSNNFKGGDGSSIIFTKASINNNSLTLERGLATPDQNEDEITKLVFYQGKPAQPLYFEGINYLVFELADYDDLDLTCQIVKVTRNSGGYLELGDVIAESVTSAEEVVEGYHFSDGTVWQLNWNNFYTVNEWGMTEDVDYLMIDDEFAVVIDGWNNGTFSATPIVEYQQNKNGDINTFFYLTNNEDFDDDDQLAFTGDHSHHFVGFNEAIYGYMVTNDNTDLQFNSTGGKTNIKVQPMLWTGDNEDPTLIFIENILENGEEVDDIDWLHIGIENEIYTQEEFSFDIAITADAQSQDAAERKATIVFMQPGARLTVNVTQDANNADNIATSATLSDLNGNVRTYSLDGRQLKAKKGLVVSNGKKFIVK